jgi:hypothetical protein
MFPHLEPDAPGLSGQRRSLCSRRVWGSAPVLGQRESRLAGGSEKAKSDDRQIIGFAPETGATMPMFGRVGITSPFLRIRFCELQYGGGGDHLSRH